MFNEDMIRNPFSTWPNDEVGQDRFAEVNESFVLIIQGRHINEKCHVAQNRKDDTIYSLLQVWAVQSLNLS